ncbi:hypothetical protein D910_06737 [Dendroctonus ponderosae]|uniref:UDP-N-acetylglucosamine--dolichyl-phosphate N-acetylglucosaminephosphotransferase n=1 Tax=Dendroctonus ponderosae TaxID=77166 RepID=U4UFM3_DENPD|nr:hypothetical protein D910_06737 [Dendroctonus ponderosae]
MALDVDVDNRDKYLSLVDNEHSANQLKMFPHVVNIFMAFLSYLVTLRVIPKLKDKFIKANLFGIDMSKTTSDKVPESLGVVSGFIFLVTMVLFIPVAFGNSLLEKDAFPYDEYVKYILALLSICCMLLLGFADDVLDVPWRQKLLLPTIASLPLLMVYYVSFNTTSIIVPKPFREWLGVSLDIGIIYYVYMGMLAVFCTNAINILAGVNGLEAGQSVVIAISIAIFNLLELSGPLWKAHQFSLYFMWPYIGTSPSNEIPDRSSLIFMKFYENIPEPIYFRLKWSVFGFFWIHPKKTVISGGACTVSYLRNELNNDLNTLTSSKTIATFASKGILLGDLNHTGGWFCEYCASPQDIIEFFTSNSSKQLINWNQIGTDKITHKFIENLIELGLYIDGKSELGRGHRYPASVFVGDTFCYFSGMTFAVVGILGRFSKTALLFFIPQVFNFLYSFPQLMKLIPCPRHRLPKFNSRTDKMECSTTVFQYSELSVLGKIVISLFRVFRLIRWEEKNGVVVTNNFTLINLVLLYFGPMHEAKLSTVLLGIQFLCTLLAFVIRYPFASVFYDVDSVN